MTDYPDRGVPYPFFFNGEELPRWSAQWHLCSLGDLLNNFVDDPITGWDEFVGYQHIWHLQCRIDHVGSIDSEDPGVFHVCAQEVLRVMLLHRDHVIRSIEAKGINNIATDEIYVQIVAGTARMIELCARDGSAFWTSGSEEDRTRVLNWMQWSALPPGDPDYRESPHLAQRRAEQILRTRSQLSDLRTLAQTESLEKPLRQIISQLPEPADHPITQ
ncbi:hypothetical protein [Brevifollis gellanilyticus]|uniref:Uncharacterized protein n=1 Tax=Brevifollis gellanilyticus TaxID=748831 RepID=A0A512MEJ8_9BACT|nr:hypothetical protein [Brevifollis gellanilyticus]GEP45122.1 hypothetical protein BGE01nite_44130 [Brevifollis gellanilyticus]